MQVPQSYRSAALYWQILETFLKIPQASVARAALAPVHGCVGT